MRVETQISLMGAGQVWLHCGGLKILRTKFDSLSTHLYSCGGIGRHTCLKSKSLKKSKSSNLFRSTYNALLVEFGRHGWLRTSCFGIASSSLAGGT